MTATCAHCHDVCRLTDGREVYPHRKDLADLRFWVCDSCDARVGCHRAGAKTETGESDGTLPLGSAANAELRAARSKLHARLDPIWKAQPKKDRRTARRRVYRVISRHMNLPPEEAHVGMFNLDQCRAAWVALNGITSANIMHIGKYSPEMDVCREPEKESAL